jgi:hypothetical protein
VSANSLNAWWKGIMLSPPEADEELHMLNAKACVMLDRDTRALDAQLSLGG